MEVPLEQPAEEIKHLQRCINDLVSVLALPAIWAGGEPSRVTSTLIDALRGMLRLDLIYVRLNESVGGAPIEFVWTAQLRNRPAPPREIGEVVDIWLEDDSQKWPLLVRSPMGEGDISVMPLRLGLHGEVGLIVTGSERPDFPECSGESGGHRATRGAASERTEAGR
jgi:hypothetical protein